jgi:hypothetical protein
LAGFLVAGVLDRWDRNSRGFGTEPSAEAGLAGRDRKVSRPRNQRLDREKLVVTLFRVEFPIHK